MTVVDRPTLDETLTDRDALNQAYLIGKHLGGTFSEDDVYNKQELYDAAMAYLDAYIGSFQFLTNMQQHVANGRMLTVPMVRGILNSMMQDAEYRMAQRHKPALVPSPIQKAPVQPAQTMKADQATPRKQRARKARRAVESAHTEQPSAPRRKRTYEEIFGEDAA